ncbi:hypothetical protein BC832DRAFT_555853 [Gaertneriomyces semiglobifer]|nr:hypothetical protein BC832DRAFT_555853 [Gaertneriomyces semiglobifer]
MQLKRASTVELCVCVCPWEATPSDLDLLNAHQQPKVQAACRSRLTLSTLIRVCNTDCTAAVSWCIINTQEFLPYLIVHREIPRRRLPKSKIIPPRPSEERVHPRPANVGAMSQSRDERQP